MIILYRIIVTAYTLSDRPKHFLIEVVKMRPPRPSVKIFRDRQKKKTISVYIPCNGGHLVTLKSWVFIRVCKDSENTDSGFTHRDERYRAIFSYLKCRRNFIGRQKLYYNMEDFQKFLLNK